MQAGKAQSPTFGANAQHTANYLVAAQHLNSVRWSTPVDLDNGGAFAHYGAPLITSANTVIVPVRTASGFLIRAFDGSSGRLKYTITNDYIPPTLSNGTWFPVYQPVLANPPSEARRLYYPGPGGTTYYITNPDSDTPPTPVQQCFYTNLDGYASNAAAFNTAVVINTPMTAAPDGVIFFGFRVQTTNAAPAPLSTTNNGFARMDPSGASTCVFAGPAAGDAAIYRDCQNSAPALSNDGQTLYVPVKGATTTYCYLLGLDTTTLATKYKVQLRDPNSGSFAAVLDSGTASPLVGPDGEVYFGVFGSPNNGSRGYLLHFSADLKTQKLPGAFGWDYTPAIVPASLVPSYTGASPYLLFSKYNDYAGNETGSGVNRIALLDPNAPQSDSHSGAARLREMREIIAVAGPTPDADYYGGTFPYAVREWCINTAALNPATHSVFAPSEDGHIYRWDLQANALTEAYAMGPGIGAPYVPTAIGPDGTIYSMNGGTLFAFGNFTNLSISLASSAPDVRTAVAGQPITFTVVVTNLGAVGPAPAGTVTFEDITYSDLDAITNTLAANVPLANGIAAASASSLSAGSNYLGNHFITATYNGDNNFSPATVTLVQKVHASATSTALSSTVSNTIVTLTATVTPLTSITNKPRGMISFLDGSNFLGQTPLNPNSVAVLAITNLPAGSHTISASYSSDTMFASSSASVVPVSPNLHVALVEDGTLHITFSNTVGAPFTVLGSADVSTPPGNWTVLGSATESPPGHFEFVDPAPNAAARFYRVRSP